MRVSMHSGKEGLPRHNDRSFDITKSDHIDEYMLDANKYQSWNGAPFVEAEQAWYERYKPHLDAQNARNLKQRHPERNKSVEDLLKGAQTRPTETIYQIGDRTDLLKGIDERVLWECYQDYASRRDALVGEHFKVLDVALHADEMGGVHIHERSIWEYVDADGHPAIGQNKALSALGYERPDTEAPAGRYNNAKITYDKQMRKLWQDVCMEHGLEIETEPIPGRRHLRTEEYIYDQQRKHIQQNQERFAEASRSLQEARDALEDINGLTAEKMADLERLKADIEASKRELGIVKDARPHGTAKRSLLNRDIYKLHKEDYVQLLAKAAIADSLKDTAANMERAHNVFLQSAMQEAEARVRDSYSVEIAMLKAEKESQEKQVYYYQLGKIMEPVATQQQKEQARSHVQNITKARD